MIQVSSSCRSCGRLVFDHEKPLAVGPRVECNLSVRPRSPAAGVWECLEPVEDNDQLWRPTFGRTAFRFHHQKVLAIGRDVEVPRAEGRVRSSGEQSAGRSRGD